MINGVDGFNNNTKGGEKVWQSPAYPGPEQLSLADQQKFRKAFQSNIEKIFKMMNRKRLGVAPNLGPEQLPLRRTPQDQLAPPRPQPLANFPVSAPISGPQYQPPQQFGVPNPGAPMAPVPRAPQTFNVPLPNQPMQLTAQPQPNAERLQRPAAPSMHAAPQAQIHSASTVQDHPLRDDIKRLEARISHLLEVVDRKGLKDGKGGE